MGFSGDMLKWFVSYLKDRKQFAVVNGCSSQTKPVTCGVPQGSLLGPRLFTYYINDPRDSITEGTWICMLMTRHYISSVTMLMKSVVDGLIFV